MYRKKLTALAWEQIAAKSSPGYKIKVAVSRALVEVKCGKEDEILIRVRRGEVV